MFGSPGEPSYQTAPLIEYSAFLRHRVEELFDVITRKIGSKARRYKGSFSVFGNRSKETAAKIVIYQRGLGRENGTWPAISDGVYILVRCNGAVGRAIWDADMLRSNPFHQRLNRNQTLGIAPKHRERFAYFRLGTKDDIEVVGDLLATCASA